MSKKYDSKSIVNLSGVEHMRLRTGMWIGGRGHDGVLHLLNEAIDNSTDETSAGFCDEITISVKDLEGDERGHQIISVQDNGRGIPFGKNDKVDEVFTSLFTDIFAGGKFNESNYNSSTGGLNGVGLKAINSYSSLLIGNSVRDGYSITQTFSRGYQSSDVKYEKTKSKVTGTTITFIPDPEIFGDATITEDDVIFRAKCLASLIPGLKINVSYNDSEVISYVETEELKSIMDRPSEGELFYFEMFSDRVKIRLGYYDTMVNESYSFCNNIYTKDGGSHDDSVISVLLSAIKKHTRKNVSKQIINSGLRYVISVSKMFPEFRGQNKTRIQDSEIREFVYEDLYEPIFNALGKNKKFIKFISDLVASQEKVFEEAASKEMISDLRETSKFNILPQKLKAVFNCSPEDRELFIVEGDSAGGTAKSAANPRYQEVLPLRGKILNITKTDISHALKNREIRNILISIGGMEGSNTPVRAKNVFWMPDSDPDGDHITCLGICLMVVLFPSFLEKYNFYLCEPALFTAHNGSKRSYGHTAREAGSRFKKMYKSDKYEISRNKGLGEMDAEELKLFMDKETRKVTKITIDHESVDMVREIMGDVGDVRKMILSEIQDEEEGGSDE